MPNNERLLRILKTLQERTDEESWITTADLRACLEAEGEKCAIRTLRTEIGALQNCGFDVGVRERDGHSTEYAWLDREWSMPELQILVDAVSAAQFIPQARSEEFIQRLAAMAGPSYADKLRPQILVSEHVKAKNNHMIFTVQAIRRAIEHNKKITFRYLQYTPDMQQVPRHRGTAQEQYIVSPYATVWNDDRYYLVGWSDKRRKVVVFRIDRMRDTKQMLNKRVPPPEDFDIRDYTDKVFRMYGGAEEKVTFRCKLEILDQVVDRFGDSITLRDVDRECFTFSVPVSLSTTFFAWVFQFAGQMRILSPGYVREKYAEYLGKALDEAMG